MATPPIAAAAEPLLEFDRKVRAAVVPYKGTVPVKVLGWLSDVGDQRQLRIVAGTMFLAGVVRSDARMARAGLRMFIAHELATVAKNFIKHRVDRTRPRSTSQSSEQKPRPGHSRQKEETSFPSGHSAGSMAVARAFVREYPEHRAAAYALAGGIALAQIPRCAHYPSDVVVGLAVGAAAEELMQLTVRAGVSAFSQTGDKP
ncbi:MAG: phosphatase family protein [Novosphingobium sp.]|nr:phosphatase family protein [Novosphingobium sp.]